MPARKQLEESLKIEQKDARTRQLAIENGTERLKVLAARYDAGLDRKEKTLLDYGEVYLLDAYKGYLENEKLIKAGYEPKHRNRLAKALWTKHTYGQQEGYFRYLVKPFFELKKYDKPITLITQKDIFEWDEWRKTGTDRNKPYAPSSIQKHNTLIRMIMKYAILEGERFVPPILPEEPKNLAARRRPEVDDDTFNKMYALLRLRNGMSSEFKSLSKAAARLRNSDYLLYCWLETLEHFGIRGGLGENPIKISDIEQIEVDGKPQFFLTRNEKGHTYTAAGYRYWEKTFNRLNRFYAAQGMPNRTYLFEHYESRGNNYRRGDPIRSFSKRWTSMCKALHINEGVTEKNKRITPYSIRHRALGRAIMQPNTNVLEVAKAYGTSVGMIEKIYLHYQVNKNYDKLVETDISRYGTCDIYSPYTGMVVRQIEADTPEHAALWKKDPSVVEFEPSRTPERWT